MNSNGGKAYVEITLPVGASAEPDTCGSCKFFSRDDLWPVGSGTCRIKMPPGVASRYMLPGVEIENSFELDRIPDSERCDLQRPDGKTYIVQRKVGG